ncbi:Hypothetical Ke4-like protein H13N06.5 in chromosome X, putative [Brugia malayi]|nr:putative Ke4-like protein H13N06.5 in chromosome X, putative [Brugia malayi]VIO89287.1 Hypothetical Ke4-like protein H13N06.5 in chromosome X, putative [Brugia malayi]
MNIAIVVQLILFHIVVLRSSHHDHSHNVETPHFKYSREANEQSVHENHRYSHHHDHNNHHHHHDQQSHHHEHSESHRSARDKYFHEKEHHHAHLTGESDRHHQKYSKTSQKNYKPYDPNGILSFMNDFRTRLWVYSIGSTLLISFMPFVFLSLIPLKANTAENESMLKILLSFGSGGLLGDAFLHLIPHAQPSHHNGQSSHSDSYAHDDFRHSHEPHDMTVGSYVLAGILTFLTVEKLVRILRSEYIIHSHSHGNGSSSSDDQKKIGKQHKADRVSKEKKSYVSSTEESLHSCSDDEHKHLIEKTSDVTGFKVAAYLNMVADFAHNFTDGLAIGASFYAGTTIGVVTMITVLVHEIPHEAMSVQLLTALGALTGCVLSLCSTNADELSDTASSSWILPFTAGGFIYIATVTVIPELLENTSVWQSIKEVVALLTGIALMFLIAAYE